MSDEFNKYSQLQNEIIASMDQMVLYMIGSGQGTVTTGYSPSLAIDFEFAPQRIKQRFYRALMTIIVDDKGLLEFTTLARATSARLIVFLEERDMIKNKIPPETLSNLITSLLCNITIHALGDIKAYQANCPERLFGTGWPTEDD